MGMVDWLCTVYIWDPRARTGLHEWAPCLAVEEMLKGDGHLAAGAMGASLSGISLDWQDEATKSLGSIIPSRRRKAAPKGSKSSRPDRKCCCACIAGDLCNRAQRLAEEMSALRITGRTGEEELFY